MRLIHVLCGSVLLGSLVLLAGCFETKTPLGSMDAAKVDRAFCGDWNLGNDKDGKAIGTLVIRNLNDKQYYAEMLKPGEESLRMLGYLVEVKGIPIAHLRNLDRAGEIGDTWLLVRIEIAGDKLTFRQFSEAFFKEKPVDTAEKLRKLIEDNINNNEMYDEEAIVGERIAK